MNKQLDVVLIHPGHRTRIYQSLGDELSGIETPVWAGLMATFVRRHGCSVAIIDAEAENLSPEQIALRLAELKPLLSAVVVYGHQPSASTQNMTMAGEICAAIKEAEIGTKTLLLGGHVAALPQRTLGEEGADFVAGGEGPYTLLDLIEALKSKTPALDKVRGLWYREDGVIKSNPIPPLLMDVDNEMPTIAWDLLPMKKYRAHNWHCFGDLNRQPYAAIYTTLGCPYHCSFCCIQAPFKEGEKQLGLKPTTNSYRFWSPKIVADQIGYLVENHGVRNLRISDEMFVLNMRHVNAICDAIIERGYNVNMWAYARVDTVKGDQIVEKLKKAGFNWLCLGIESASERVRDDVEKGYSQELIYQTVNKVRSGAISIIANYIFGLPEENLESMQSTLDQALDLNCEFANFYCAMAYPGSELYRLAVSNGWPLPKEWAGYSQHSVDSLPLPTKHLKASEVLRFRDQAWHTYFSNPRYLKMINEKFGAPTVEHVRAMASHKLVRQHA